MVAPYVSGKLTGRKPHGGISIKELQGGVQGFDGSDTVAVKLIDHPQQTMHFDLPVCRKGAKTPVTGEKNAAGVTFGKSERETVMDGELRNLPSNRSHPTGHQHRRARRINT
ncbi:MAG TPA: hypothetical protein PLY42_19185, partial [Nitrospira sp.]|nr:hypothetical protein [Nitrospira sp.]HNA28337.1 hypothetical protein [Nitrospira sp.]